ncbi:MAG: WVD2 family protein [Luminiphilus sp.]
MIDNDEIRARLSAEIDAAVGYADSQLSEDRIEATEYYLGKQFNSVADGKSSIVSTEVADVIEYMMPSLMEVFMRSGEIVRFLPRHPDDTQKADAATMLVNSIFQSQNNGFTILHDFIKDALLYKCGVIKCYYDTDVTYTSERYEGVTELDVAALSADPEVEVLRSESISTEDPPLFEIFDVELRRTKRVSRIKIDNIAPEDFLFSPQATSIEDASFVAHRTYMTVGELIAQGYDRDEVEQRVGLGEGWDEQETQIRHDDVDGGNDQNYAMRQNELVRVVEGYVPLDMHDTGISTLHRVLAIGQDNHVLDVTPVDRAPFVCASPIRVPHRLVGRSVAEMVTDIQRVKSVALRGVLDNLYLSNDARVAVVEGRVNLDDMLQSRPGGIVRMDAPGMVQPLPVPQVGPQGMALLNYMDEVRDTRTGFSKASLGLDPDALQSTTAAAVNATIQGGQAKVLMIARTLAETGMRPLAQLLLALAVKHLDQPQSIRVGGDMFTQIDPASIDVEFDVDIDVGLGSGRDAERTMALQQVAQIQRDILQELGPMNPVVAIEQYLETIKRIGSMAGIKDIDTMFATPEQLAAFRQQQAQQPPQEDPEVAQKRAEFEADIALRREKQQADIALEREKLEAELALKQQEMAVELELRRAKLAMGDSAVSTNIPGAV